MDDEIDTDHLKFQINLQIYNEIHEIHGFTQGFNRKSIDLSTKNHGFQFYEKRWRYNLDVIRNRTASESKETNTKSDSIQFYN